MNQERELEISRLIKGASIVVIILGVFLLVQTMSSYKNLRGANPSVNSISVVGEGEAFGVADIATFSFGVSADADSVSEAQKQVTEKMNSIFTALKELGIEEKDIKTSNYSVYPKYKFEDVVCRGNICPPSQQVPDGYTVSHDVTVKVRKTDDAGKVLSMVGDKGATNVSGLTFITDDRTALQNEARAMAIEDAKEQAKILAKSLGVRLGDVITYYDNNNPGGYPTPMYAGKEAMAQDAGNTVSISLGENQVVSNVTVVYEIR